MRSIFQKALFLTLPFLLFSNGVSDPSQGGSRMKMDFEYSVRIPKVPEKTKELRVLLPIPSTDKIQKVNGLTFNIPYPYELKRDPEHGNKYVQVRFQKTDIPSRVEFSIKGGITRKEVTREKEYRKDTSGIAQALRPDSLIPLDDRIEKEAQKASPDTGSVMTTTREYYDYLIESMQYDKSGTGWGKGDAIHACTAKEGNCTDFHSLFIGMSRVREIPARFHIGFMVPPDQMKGRSTGYHCWAEFHNGEQWVPVDVSEAWKDPDKKDYYFGGLDPHRVHISTGRDIPVEIAKGKKRSLNYFVHPKAYSNGKELKELEWEFTFHKK